MTGATGKSFMCKSFYVPFLLPKNAGPRLSELNFSTLPPPPSRKFFCQIFELSTKAAFAKAAFDTLKKSGVKKQKRNI